MDTSRDAARPWLRFLVAAGAPVPPAGETVAPGAAAASTACPILTLIPVCEALLGTPRKTGMLCLPAPPSLGMGPSASNSPIDAGMPSQPPLM